MRVVIAGATGLVGRHLLKLLLNDDSIQEIIVLTRRSIKNPHSKLKEIIFDFDSINDFKDEIRGDILYCCLGTTIKKAGSKEAFRKIDFDYSFILGKIAKENQISKYLIITALGASASSVFFYNQIKGEVQNSLSELNLESLCFIQPSLILGQRDEQRVAEQFFVKLSPVTNMILQGPLKKYRAIEASQIALAMYKISLKENLAGVRYFESDVLSAIN